MEARGGIDSQQDPRPALVTYPSHKMSTPDYQSKVIVFDLDINPSRFFLKLASRAANTAGLFSFPLLATIAHTLHRPAIDQRHESCPTPDKGKTNGGHLNAKNEAAEIAPQPGELRGSCLEGVNQDLFGSRSSTRSSLPFIRTISALISA